MGSAVSSWDEFPVHQAAEFVRHPVTSDRNFYDRYYFNLHGCSDELFVIMGFGQYPNLGTQDAFVNVRRGDLQHVVRSSKPLEDRMDLATGPLRVEVIEPLKKLRVVCEPTEHSVALDVTWEGSVPAHEEPRHFLRAVQKVTFDTQRFAQTGYWSGTLTVGEEEFQITPDRWWGTRDRSWGVRPIGEQEPEGIRAGKNAMAGMWNYFPMQFADHSIVYIVQERESGERTMEDATRIRADGRKEWLGRPEWDHRFEPGTRVFAGSTITFADSGIEVTCEPLLHNFFTIGTGYGVDEDWRHGMYQGPELVVQGLTHEVGDIRGLAQYLITDTVGRFTYDGNEGYGLYEHGIFGAFAPLGLPDGASVAPA